MNDRRDSGFQRWCAPALLVAALLTSACRPEPAVTPGGVGEEGDVATIEARVMYRERMRLPPTAQVEVQLQDVSRADAMATVLETVVVPADSGPPYDVSIAYRAGDILARHRYGLRATITVGDKLLFTSTEYIDPFAERAGPVEIQVQRVPEAIASTLADVKETPEDGSWQLVQLGGGEVGPGAGGQALSLQFDSQTGQVSGFAGCNRFSGQYQLIRLSQTGGSLELGPLAATRRACAEGMGHEQGYLDTLAGVDAYHFTGDRLVLLSQGAEVAIFKAAF